MPQFRTVETFKFLSTFLGIPVWKEEIDVGGWKCGDNVNRLPDDKIHVWKMHAVDGLVLAAGLMNVREKSLGIN